MSMAIAGIASAKGVTIDDGQPIATNFPNFMPLLAGLVAA
jgi:3-phosphoshikimate 1-carboxyvinyltransferase